jgi:hypothetical protein
MGGVVWGCDELVAELRDLAGGFTAWMRTVVSHACPHADAMFEKAVSR